MCSIITNKTTKTLKLKSLVGKSLVGKSLVGKIKAALENQLLDNEYKIAWRTEVGLEMEGKTRNHLKVIEGKRDQILPKKALSQSCTGLRPST